MTRRDKNFRLSKTVKRMMAGKLCINRNQFKKHMIEAQIAASIPFKPEKKKSEVSKEE
jgi:hypothetical protein